MPTISVVSAARFSNRMAAWLYWWQSCLLYRLSPLLASQIGWQLGFIGGNHAYYIGCLRCSLLKSDGSLALLVAIMPTISVVSAARFSNRMAAWLYWWQSCLLYRLSPLLASQIGWQLGFIGGNHAYYIGCLRCSLLKSDGS